MVNFTVMKKSVSAAPTAKKTGPLILNGTVTRVLFRSQTGDYAVLMLDSKHVVTCAGYADYDGRKVRVTGKEVSHPKYGTQVKASAVEVLDTPSFSHTGLARYLASSRFPGFGERLAQAIVRQFGDDTLEVIATRPKALQEVEGVGKVRASKLHEAWATPEARRESSEMVFLLGLEITEERARSLREKYAQDGGAESALRKNPYRLIEEVRGYGFKRADVIAKGLGIASDSAFRVRAGLVHTVDEFTTQGFCAVPESLLLEKAAALLEVSPERVAEGLSAAVSSAALVRDIVNGTPCLATPGLHRIEREAAKRVGELAAGPKFDTTTVNARIAALEKQFGILLHQEQRAAIATAVQHPLCVITGGPGTGKSTIARFIVKLYQELKLQVVMAAPTGKAAVRQTEVAGDLLGKPANTLHRLLMARMGGVFLRNKENPLEGDVFLVDEPSMLDVPLFWRLLDALKPGSRLVLTGDVDQLPSVGPGKVLSDLIQSGAVPVARLTQVYRQAAQSPIWLAAQALCQGNGSGALAQAGSPAFKAVLVQSASDIQAAVTAAIADLKGLGVDPVRGVQVMTAGHNGSAGTIALNALLQQNLNGKTKPLALGQGEFRVGDKVLQTVNDYNLGVVNGDVGVITGTGFDDNGPTLNVNFNGARVGIPIAKVKNLKLAYAMTVHKMQGSEAEAAVLVLSLQHYMLLKRNLAYTGFTRAKKYLRLIVEPKAFHIAAAANPVEERWTKLAEWLRAAPANAGTTGDLFEAHPSK